MQEMGRASSILEAASRETRQFPGYRTSRIGIAIGERAGMDAESLRLCFEVLTKEPEPVPIDLDICWCPGGELKLAYVELEEVSNDQRKQSGTGF
jgi:Zn finger protein HypA/HybF involved in hydrogenase expression